MAKYIDIPFATNGNKNAIPDTTTDGTVNYNDGFGADYAKPIGTDPSAKSVDRQTINQVLYDYGSAIQQLQENGFFPWQSTKAGGYDIGAAVSYSGANYINTVAGNTNAPDVSGWIKIGKMSATDILTELETVDGVGSGLDTDLVRGLPADFTSSKAANGYQKLPSGVIMQWGLDTPFSLGSNSSAIHSITFPIAFPNGVLFADCSKHIDNNGSASQVSADVKIGTPSTTGLTIAYDNLGPNAKTVGGAWLAIGY